MLIEEYLIKNDITKVEFAAKCGKGVSTIYRWAAGGKMHRASARIIQKVTKNKITVEELWKDGQLY